MTEYETGKSWEQIVPRVDSDTSSMYVTARIAGLTVTHGYKRSCQVWDSIDGLPGVFRKIGWVRFNKRTRRWTVQARFDCEAVDLCSLIAHGLRLSERFGQRPGHEFRKKQWYHGTFDGDPVAYGQVSRCVDREELLGSEFVVEQVPDTVQELLSIG